MKPSLFISINEKVLLSVRHIVENELMPAGISEALTELQLDGRHAALRSVRLR